jgi:hypothetical protein
VLLARKFLLLARVLCAHRWQGPLRKGCLCKSELGACICWRPRFANGGEQWIEAADEKGNLDISSLAYGTNLRPETLKMGGLALRKHVTIQVIRSVLGSAAGTSKGSALAVDGKALPLQLPIGQFLFKVVFLSGACIVRVLMETYLEFLHEAQLFLMLLQMMTSIEGMFQSSCDFDLALAVLVP